MNRIKGALLLAAAAALLSCATGQDVRIWEGRTENYGSYPHEWILSCNEAGQASLSLPYGEGICITGEAFPRDGGQWIFHMDYLEWFSNWHRGWTEARFGMTGSLLLIPDGQEWRMEIQELPDIDSVLEGQIRYKENRYYGDRSRDMVSRRWARISAAVPFIGEELDMDAYEFSHKKKGFYSKEFLRDLESLLFPELYGYSEKFPEPDGGNSAQAERYVREENVHWDTLYSRTYLPEELQPLRDSGTLLRDYEEGSGLFVMALTWNLLWEEMIPASHIVRINEGADK